MATAWTDPTTGKAYSAEEVANYMATHDASSLAKDAATLGLNQSQIAGFMQAGGNSGGNTGIINSNISSFVKDSSNGYSWGTDGKLMKNTNGAKYVAPGEAPMIYDSSPNSGGSWGGGGGEFQPGQDLAGSNHIAGNREGGRSTATGLGQSSWTPGMQYNTGASQGATSLNVNGTVIDKATLQDFYARGGNDMDWLRKNGVTDPAQLRAFAMQARDIAGNAPQGDAAFQQYYAQYKAANPNGMDFNTWKASLGANQRAIEMGVYTGEGDSASAIAPANQVNAQNGILASGSSATSSNSGSAMSGSSTSGTSTGSSNAGTTPWNVTPEQTVEERVRGILASGSPLIEQQRAQSDQAMVGRGLYNSSIARTASDAAAYQAALPIAQADAATFSKAAGYNADQKNQFATNDMNRAAQLEIARLNAETSKTIASWNNTESAKALQLQLSNKTLLDSNAQAAQAFNTGMSAVNNIQMNDKMDATAKTQAIANVWHNVQLQLKTLSAVSGINLNAELQFAGYPGFDDQGRWVGFDAPAASTSAPTTTTSTNGSSAIA